MMILLYHEGIHSYTQCPHSYNTYHLGEAQSSCPRSRHGMVLHGKDEHDAKGIHGLNSVTVQLTLHGRAGDSTQVVLGTRIRQVSS
jgi:hypothetical protein